MLYGVIACWPALTHGCNREAVCSYICSWACAACDDDLDDLPLLSSEVPALSAPDAPIAAAVHPAGIAYTSLVATHRDDNRNPFVTTDVLDAVCQ